MEAKEALGGGQVRLFLHHVPAGLHHVRYWESNKITSVFIKVIIICREKTLIVCIYDTDNTPNCLFFHHVLAGFYNLLYLYINLYTNTVLDDPVILSVNLFVRYRNHFPVVQFKNQAHIRNLHDPADVCKTMGR